MAAGYTNSVTFASLNINPTTQITRYSVTGTVPSNSSQIGVIFSYTPSTPTALANDIFVVANVQLEEGSVATPFRRNANSIQGELAACQRYFFRWLGNAGDGLAHANFWITNRAAGTYNLPVQMRTAPIISFSGTWHILSQNANIQLSAIGAISSTPYTVGLDVYVASGGTQNTGGLIRANVVSGTANMDASAEL